MIVSAAVLRYQIVLLLASASLLSFQIVLLQLLATSQWHYFAYFVISCALLGFGAAGAALVAAGQTVSSCFLSGDVDVRSNRPEVELLHEQSRAAQRILGFEEPVFGPFPNIRFNTAREVA